MTRRTGARSALAIAAVLLIPPRPDDRNVSAARCGDEYFFHRLFVREPRVEVVGAPSGGEREVAGVYVVRADLVWVDAQAARGERGDYSARYRRFSAAAVDRGDEYARALRRFHFISLPRGRSAVFILFHSRDFHDVVDVEVFARVRGKRVVCGFFRGRRRDRLAFRQPASFAQRV